MELKTLQDAFSYFSDPQNAVDYVVALRWPEGVSCPTCGSKDVTYLKKRYLYQCHGKHPKRQFSPKVGTVMESSPISLGNWLIVSWMLACCRNGVSSYEIARTIGITQKSAWFMLHRLREAMTEKSISLQGEVEVDEAFIGGLSQNKHLRKRLKKEPKQVVLGILERGGRVATTIVPEATKEHIIPALKRRIEPGTVIYSDSSQIYNSVAHGQVSHISGRYVEGPIHTNGIENFFSTLKRTLKGTYIQVSPYHLPAYVSEQAFRYNHRKKIVYTEAQRFGDVVVGGLGKRLTWNHLVRTGRGPVIN